MEIPSVPRPVAASQLPLFQMRPHMDKLCSRLAWVSALLLCCLLGSLVVALVQTEWLPTGASWNTWEKRKSGKR